MDRLMPIQIQLDPIQHKKFSVLLAAASNDLRSLKRAIKRRHQDAYDEDDDEMFRQHNEKIFEQDVNEQGINVIHIACALGNLQMLEYVLHNGGATLMNDQDRKGRTPLHYAATNQCNECAEMLVEIGICDLNLKDQLGMTALHIAAYHNNEYLAMILLDSGRVELDVRDKNGRTPLHYAALNGSDEVLNMLIGNEDEKGASVGALDNEGRSPAMHAVEYNHLECLTSLYPVTSNVPASEINKQDKEGLTALHIACLNSHKDCVEYLLVKGSDVGLADNTGRTPLMAAAFGGSRKCIDAILTAVDATARPALIAKGDKNKRTAIFYAAMNNKKQALRKLFFCNADINQRDNIGFTPVHWICYCGHWKCLQILTNVEVEDAKGLSLLHLAVINGHLKCVEYLVDSLKGNVNFKDGKGRTALHKAAKGDHSRVVEFLVGRGAAIDAPDVKGITPLLLCLRYGSINSLSALLQNNPNLGLTDKRKRNCIHFCSMFGNSDCLKFLVEHQQQSPQQLQNILQKMNESDTANRTPLHYAAMKGFAQVADCLISNGANVNVMDGKGRLPLHYASYNGHLTVIQKLIDKGASVNTPDAVGVTPLMCAALNGHVLASKLLLGHSANVNATDHLQRNALHAACHSRVPSQPYATVVEELITAGCDVNSADKFNRTALHHCASYTDSEIPEMLHDHDIDLMKKDNRGNTGLHLMCYHGVNVRAVKKLLRWEEELVNAPNKAGWTPLHYNASQGNEDICDILVDFEGVDLNAQDAVGRTPAHVAAFYKQSRVLNAIFSEGAEADIQDANGKTPLHFAAYSGDFDCVEILLNRGAASAKDSYGRTALHSAAFKGHTEIVDLLIDSGWNPNETDRLGRTPMMYSCYGPESNVQCLKKLIEKNAELNITDKYGHSALMFAAAKNRSAFVTILIHAGVDPNIKNRYGQTALTVARNFNSRESFALIRDVAAEKESFAKTGSPASSPMSPRKNQAAVSAPVASASIVAPSAAEANVATPKTPAPAAVTAPVVVEIPTVESPTAAPVAAPAPVRPVSPVNSPAAAPVAIPAPQRPSAQLPILEEPTAPVAAPVQAQQSDPTLELPAAAVQSRRTVDSAITRPSAPPPQSPQSSTSDSVPALQPLKLSLRLDNDDEEDEEIPNDIQNQLVTASSFVSATAAPGRATTPASFASTIPKPLEPSTTFLDTSSVSVLASAPPQTLVYIEDQFVQVSNQLNTQVQRWNKMHQKVSVLSQQTSATQTQLSQLNSRIEELSLEQMEQMQVLETLIKHRSMTNMNVLKLSKPKSPMQNLYGEGIHMKFLEHQQSPPSNFKIIRQAVHLLLVAVFVEILYLIL